MSHMWYSLFVQSGVVHRSESEASKQLMELHCGFHNLKRSLQMLLPPPPFFSFQPMCNLLRQVADFVMCPSHVIKPLINLDKRYLLTMCLIV